MSSRRSCGTRGSSRRTSTAWLTRPAPEGGAARRDLAANDRWMARPAVRTALLLLRRGRRGPSRCRSCSSVARAGGWEQARGRDPRRPLLSACARTLLEAADSRLIDRAAEAGLNS